ncbi:MAG: ribonuclease domain-containing protein [Lachnospiraceae bacterium]|nr:ribonuclease domain-containing protein [Lachnospiraceae bacterium]
MKDRIRKLTAWLLMTLLVISLAAGCSGSSVSEQSTLTGSISQQNGLAGVDSGQNSLTDGGELQQEEAAEPGFSSDQDSKADPAADIEESGSYTSRDEVALYLHAYGHLPDNYITKKEAEALGWDSKKGNLWDAAPGMSIGGSRFGNYEGLLPDEKGRTYFECDIDYEGGYRGAKRIIYSNDGLVFYTEDHYKTFEQLY